MSNPQAFPTGACEYDGQGNVLPYQTAGMSLRDYFAAKAMQGFLVGDALIKEADTASDWLSKTADASYEMADAMMKVRNEKVE